MMCCRLIPCKNGKNFYIYKNTKLAEGTVADVSAQMFENVLYSDLKWMENSFIRIFLLRWWSGKAVYNRLSVYEFEASERRNIFQVFLPWQLWISSWMHFFIWRADIGIYCCSDLSSKTATKLQKKKRTTNFKAD